jgi:hypothetical protein
MKPIRFGKLQRMRNASLRKKPKESVSRTLLRSSAAISRHCAMYLEHARKKGLYPAQYKRGEWLEA